MFIVRIIGNPLVTVQGFDIHSTDASTTNILLVGEEGVGPCWTVILVMSVLHGSVYACPHLWNEYKNFHAKKLVRH